MANYPSIISVTSSDLELWVRGFLSFNLRIIRCTACLKSNYNLIKGIFCNEMPSLLQTIIQISSFLLQIKSSETRNGLIKDGQICCSKVG